MKENREKVDMYDFPVHDYTQEQNGSPYSISNFDNANGLSRKIVVVQKFCYHGNLTSHFCSLFAKQQICMCSTLFCTFLCAVLHDNVTLNSSGEKNEKCLWPPR